MHYRSIFGQSNLFFTNGVYIVANSHTRFEELLSSSHIAGFLLRFSSTFNNPIYIKASPFALVINSPKLKYEVFIKSYESCINSLNYAIS